MDAKTRPSIANVEAEAALLGALMQESSLIDAVCDSLPHAAFSEPLHSRIYEAIVREHNLGKTPTPVLLKPYFDGDEDMRELGGLAYLARLTANMEGLLNPRELTQQLRDLARRRDLSEALSGALDLCRDLESDTGDIVSRIDAAIDTRGGETLIESDAAETMQALLTDLDTEHKGVTCGRIEQLDGLLGKIEPKSLTIIAARPGMGKTALATSYALGAARSGHGTLFVSLEMSREELAKRMVADVCFDDADKRVPYAHIRDRNLAAWERDMVNLGARWIASLPLAVVDAGALRIGRLRRLVRSRKRRMAVKGQALEVVIVDYLQLLHPDEKKRSAYEAISEISTGLKQIAKDEGVAVIALAQLSRSVESRTDKRPILSDLRDSGQIEQDADAVLFLLREEYYLKQTEPQNDIDAHEKWQAKMDRALGVIEFILAKRRNGTTGTVKGRFYGAYQAVR